LASTTNKTLIDEALAVWVPSKPTAWAALDFAGLDVFEVNILNDEEGPKIVAAIELVSPANKDRPAHRRAFAVKCVSCLQEGISVIMVDVVTERRGNLHADLLELLKLTVGVPGQADGDLYAAAGRPLLGAEQTRLDLWAEALAIGAPLPTLPLWLSPELALPLNLEETYRYACAARRIEGA
jgi:hypothetical protein